MYIDAIEVYYVTLPLIYPWRTGYGEDAEIHSILVRMVSGSSEGWGETTPFYAPTYSPETATSAFFLISELFAPELVGRDIHSAKDLLGRLNHFKGNPFAKAGPESAWWVLSAVISNQPLHCLLGGKSRKVLAGADFGVQDSIDMLLEKIQTAISRGFERVKLKVRPGWDLEILRVVRSTFPKLMLQIDCNGSYTLDDLPFFKAVDGLGLIMIEQPLFHTDLIDHAELQKNIYTPICLDESIKSVRDFELALRLGSCRVLNIKYGRVGGLSIAVKLHDVAKENGIPCWVGGMLESIIGESISIELATLPNFEYPNDLWESRSLYQTDLTDKSAFLNPDCSFTPSTVPGVPYKPMFDRIEAATVRKAIVRAS